MGLDRFRIEPHTHLDQPRDVYRLGNGPAVIILSEVPGITPQVIRFAERVAEPVSRYGCRSCSVRQTNR